MKIINIKDTKNIVMHEPLFTGKVTRQSPIADDDGSDLSINYIHFPKAIRNKFHKHSNDQILIVLKGYGIVATKKKAFNVKKGDIIWTKAGEVHRHGAGFNSSFSHISITRSHTKLTQIEK